MSRVPRQPKYRLHEARNCAVVTLNGMNHYLGAYESPESYELYARPIAEWQRNSGSQSKWSVSQITSGQVDAPIGCSYFREMQVDPVEQVL